MKKYLPALIVGGWHIFLAITLQFTAWPEMFSFAYLFNNGFQIYGDMVHPYPPLLPLILSVIYSLFGYKLVILQLFTWTLFLINDYFIYKIIRQLNGNKFAALLSVACYALISITLEGNMLWYDTALTTPLLVGVYYLLAQTKYNLLYAGIAFSVASLIKQTGALYTLAALVWVFIAYRNTKSIKNFTLPVVISGVITIGWLALTNQWLWFWNWVIYYPSRYWTQFPGYVQFQLSSRDLLIIGLLLLSPFMLVVRRRNIQSMLIVSFSIVGLIGVYPRFSFFHMQPGIAFFIIATGVAYKYSRFAVIPLLFLCVTLLHIMRANWSREPRFFESKQMELATLISQKTHDAPNIYLLGLPSHLYQLTSTVPPQPWFDNYGWYFEVPQIQQQVIQSWQNNKPDYIIRQKPDVGNWYDIGVYQPGEITYWTDENYSLVDTANDRIEILKRKI